jgi:selenocysteine-specific elongation factor
MKNLVIGTAGHIDHGKTALIKAINGFEGDDTKEEKQRGITINLSFSNLQQDNTNIAFIDVPGHEKLIKNMISGAFGFDATLLVIDVNEGIMPQTIEHLQILDFLKNMSIIVTITKCDLATKQQIHYQKQQIKELFENYKNLILKDIATVSIYDKTSIKKLKNSLFKMGMIQKKSNKLFRYYIDRSFSLPGAGTIVTGTVLDGTVELKEKVFITQLEKEAIVKNIQVHEQDAKIACDSQRVALNLQNIKIPLKKGMLLSKKGFIRGFKEIDISVKTFIDHTLPHNSDVIIYIGSNSLEAKILHYDENFAKLKFKQKIFTVFNEPLFISLSGKIVAGAKVLNPINDPIKKRNKIKLLQALHNQDFKTGFDILISSHKKGFGLISSNQRFNLNHDEALIIAKKIDDIFIDEDNLVLYPKEILNIVKGIILNIFKNNQYAILSAKSILLKIKWASLKLIQDILDTLEKDYKVVLENGVYKNANIDITNIDTFIEEKIFDILNTSEITPNAPYNIYDGLDIDRLKGDKALKKLTTSKKVIRLNHNLFICYEKLNILIRNLKQIIKREGYIDIKIFKNYYPNLSRKYIISYLEYLDKQNDIMQDGLKRKLAR